MKPAKPVIELRNLRKTYQMDSVRVDALRGLDMSVKKGEFLAIIGVSGSGKSTLLHIIGLLDKPSSGKVIMDSRDISRLSDDELAEFRGKKIGFVFQFFNLYPTLTAKQNVELPLMIQEYNEEERGRKAMELLDLVGLSDRQNHMPSQLSGGQRQRVAIARSLATDPEIILADEPTGNLDTKSGQEILNTLMKINKEAGKTVIVITHDTDMAKYADRVVELKDGRIIQ
ncbi:MAG: ABC transporter ATP-binding protein [Candidatus Aenigmarchaeota archaeon]|nr:ABC transporter ATP-binding protein [Candidatus Aenigmarchaeota archaeon]